MRLLLEVPPMLRIPPMLPTQRTSNPLLTLVPIGSIMPMMVLDGISHPITEQRLELDMQIMRIQLMGIMHQVLSSVIQHKHHMESLLILQLAVIPVPYRFVNQILHEHEQELSMKPHILHSIGDEE